MESVPPGEGAAELIRKLDLFVQRNAERQKGERERKKTKQNPTTTKIKPTPLLHFPSKSKHFLLCNEKAFHVERNES